MSKVVTGVSVNFFTSNVQELDTEEFYGHNVMKETRTFEPKHSRWVGGLLVLACS